MYILFEVFLLPQRSLLFSLPGTEIPPPLSPPLNTGDFGAQYSYLFPITINSLVISLVLWLEIPYIIDIPSIPEFQAYLHLTSNEQLKRNILTYKLFSHIPKLLLPQSWQLHFSRCSSPKLWSDT